MCLYVNSVEQTATTDILVYKIILNDNKSLFKQFQYEPNMLYRYRKKLVINDDIVDGKVVGNVIYRGFHSYCDINAVKLSLRYATIYGYAYFKVVEFTIPKKVVEFTIPKGAKYYLGLDNEIVSTSIRSGSLEPIVL